MEQLAKILISALRCKINKGDFSFFSVAEILMLGLNSKQFQSAKKYLIDQGLLILNQHDDVLLFELKA